MFTMGFIKQKKGKHNHDNTFVYYACIFMCKTITETCFCNHDDKYTRVRLRPWQPKKNAKPKKIQNPYVDPCVFRCKL